MSKILFMNAPAFGHVNPTLPVVQELVTRGEQVIYYNTEEFRSYIEPFGPTFQAYPSTLLSARSMNEAVKDGNLSNASVLMLQSAEALLPFILDELNREQPDLVIFDSLAVWAKMATTILHVRAAATIGHFLFDLKTAKLTARELLLMLTQTLPQVPSLLASRRRLIRRYGKDAFPPSNPLFPMRDRMNLIFTSRELQPTMTLIDDAFHFVGPSINSDAPATDGQTKELLNALGDKPLIYISLGTIHNTHVDFYKRAFEAFRNYPWHFLLSAGKATNIEALGEIPANFTVRPTVPQLQVLQHAKFFITHGGMNSIHEALYFGVPLVSIPHQFEQLINARLVEAKGAAVAIYTQARGKEITVPELRTALDTITSNPNYRQAAARIQRNLQATGGYRQAADIIQQYIATEMKAVTNRR